MPDEVALFRSFARVVRRAGLASLNSPARRLARLALRNRVRTSWRGLTIRGGFEHWGFLVSLREGRHEPGTLHLFERLCSNGAVVVDVGANIGMYTLTAARRVGSSGTVFALEPDPRSLRHLQWNVAANDCGRVVTILNVAAGDHSGTAFLRLDPSNAGRSQLLSAYDPHDYIAPPTIQVPLRRLDDLLPAGLRVDVIKIDVEGAEVSILRGAERLLRHYAPWIICELNPIVLNTIGLTPHVLLGEFRRLNLHAYAIDEDTAALVQDWQAVLRSGKKYVNLLAKAGPWTPADVPG